MARSNADDGLTGVFMRVVHIALVAAIMAGKVSAETEFDYFQANREHIRNGVQAVLMCNGLFTSNRTLQQVFDQELRYLPRPVGDVHGGEYEVDRSLRAVAVGGPKSGPIVRAA